MNGPPDGVAFARRAAYLPAADALVVADLHLGRVERAAVQFPLGEREDVRDRLAALLERFDPAEVVVAGDILHAFDVVPQSVVESVEAVEETVAAAGANLVVTPGNHDARLAAALDGDAPAEYRLDDGTVVCHGHEEPDAGGDRYVLGHDHPAIEIEGRKHPCFLYGPGAYRGADVLVVPAFNRLVRGAAVNGMGGGDVLSPVLAGGVADYRPVVYDDDAGEALAFPPLSEFRDML